MWIESVTYVTAFAADPGTYVISHHKTQNLHLNNMFVAYISMLLLYYAPKSIQWIILYLNL